MSPQDAVAFIALVFGLVVTGMVVARVYVRRLAFKEREMELVASRTAEKAAQYAAQAERLEARVRVLERIATDKGTSLAAEIEDLRDPSVN